MMDDCCMRRLCLWVCWVILVGPTSWLHAQDVVRIEKSEDGYLLSWNSEEGVTSFLQHSQDLSYWEYTPYYHVGDGLSHGELLGDDLRPAESQVNFYRLLFHPTNLLDPDDTDGDGLPNHFELGHGYAPVLVDSDDNGISDADEDLDGDGESNITEYANGTDAGDSSSNSGGVGEELPQVVFKSRGKFQPPLGIWIYNFDDPIFPYTWYPCALFDGELFDGVGDDFYQWKPLPEEWGQWVQGIYHYNYSAEFSYFPYIFTAMSAVDQADSKQYAQGALHIENGIMVPYPIRRTFLKVVVSHDGIEPVIEAEPVTLTIPAEESVSDTITLTPGLGTEIHLLPVEVVPDWNRDGMIDEMDFGQATNENPFVFWVNDDEDEQEIHEDADIPGMGADNNDMRVNGMRDLVDFFPVALRLAPILQVLPADKYAYSISHPEGALNFLEMPDVVSNSDREGNGAGSYLANDDMASRAMGAALQSTAGEGSELSQEYLQAAQNGMGVLLFEAKQNTEQSFELVIHRKSNQAELARIPSEKWLNAVPVEDMFHYVNIRGAINEGYEVPAIEEIQHQRFRETRKDRWFVFCHGYNVNEVRARGWNAEIFKRLHQMGSDAKFLGVTWEGNQGQISESILLAGGKTPDYWKNVHNAFKSSSALSKLVNGLMAGEKVIAGHSLGNMLISSAICDHDLKAANYFMLNAAVPREAYSASHVEADREKVRNEDWKNYPTRLWPSDYWNLGFAQGDGRRKLTWRGRFATLAAKTLPHNYYSSGEDVLKSGDGSSPNLLDIVFKGEGAWIKQEMGKGKATKAFVSGIGGDGWTSTGGWEFNSDAYLSYLPNPLDPPGTPATNDPNTLTNAELKTVPFFNPFRIRDGMSVHGENGSAVAADYNNRSFLLGHDIPALSNPAGSNEIDRNIFGQSANTDMMDKLRSHHWGNWEHSDLKEEKMDHVWKLFADMVSKGKLHKNLTPPATN
ncbi:MAG: hypothetical protein ACPHYF_09540 [Akkermansiaceae bacterium]